MEDPMSMPHQVHPQAMMVPSDQQPPQQQEVAETVHEVATPQPSDTQKEWESNS